MDFPNDVATNVYCVENVTKIFWSRWSGSDIGLVRELRDSHAHVLQNSRTSNLWLFGFSENEFHDALSSHGFSETSRGSLDPNTSSDEVEKAMLAICASLCHELSSAGDWMPLGIAACVNGTSMIKFESHWDVAGRLTIIPTRSRIRKLCRVTSQILDNGRRLLLSPSGIRATYRGRLHKMISELIESSKSRYTKFLNLPALVEWILVEIDSKMTIWPAEHALFTIADRPQDFENPDPIARAETWYLGRAARAAAIAQSEIEIPHDASDGEPSEVASPAFREIIAQDMSGIYPTPPDGLLSQTPASNIQQDSSPKFVEGHGNTDLFEDMDMDLVGEADFSFFDEPELPVEENAEDQPEESKGEEAKDEETKGDESIPSEQVVEDSVETFVEEAPQNRGSFNPVPLVNLFDGKYGDKGRFGFPVEATNKEKEIFSFGAKPDSSDSEDETDEESTPYDIDEHTSDKDVVATPESSTDDPVKVDEPPPEIYLPIIATLSERGPMFGDHPLFISIAQLVADQSSLSETALQLPQNLGSVFEKTLRLARNRLLKDVADEPKKSTGSAMGIQRVGTKINVSSSAIPFWEELGLSPLSGHKDVHAFCLFPKREFFVTPVKVFLEMMKGAYQGCNLGRHILDHGESRYPHGLVPMQDAKFAEYIASRRLTGGNTVIYMLNTGKDEEIPKLCGLFLGLFDTYRKFLDDEIRNPNDLVLQIVPASMVFSSQRFAVSSLMDYKKVAFEVYDRCGPTDVQSPFLCAPAICLAKPIAVDFKMASDLMDAGDSLHLAYRWEEGEQWLTAVWTNNFGAIQWTAAYWLSTDEEIQTSFTQAAAAMQETTKDILKSQRTSYQIHVVKDGCFQNFELEALRSTDLRVTISEIGSYPIMTPQVMNPPEVSPQISSPEAPTYDENDPEARLVDITDETWTVILKSPTIQVNRPLPMSTGYLLKRAGTQNKNGLAPLRITLMYDTESRKGRMQELLSVYHNLALLARVRNVVDPVQGTFPIHVASARKAHALLCRTMRIEP